jgi:hypothetical protein
MLYVNADEQAAAKPYRQAKDIDKRSGFIFEEVTQGNAKIIFDHADDLMRTNTRADFTYIQKPNHKQGQIPAADYYLSNKIAFG